MGGATTGPAIVALVAFFAFVSDWTNFFLPYVMFYTDRQYPWP